MVRIAEAEEVGERKEQSYTILPSQANRRFVKLHDEER
jgi:hypothetical protein